MICGRLRTCIDKVIVCTIIGQSYLEWALGDLLQEFPVRSGPGGNNDFSKTVYVLYLFIVVKLGVPLLHMKKFIPRLRLV